MMKFLLAALEETQHHSTPRDDAEIGGREAKLEVDVGSRRQIVRRDKSHAPGTEVENRAVVSLWFALNRKLDG